MGFAVFVRQIAGVDAARVLLADLLSCTGAARGVGELALYWAARAKLEEVGAALWIRLFIGLFLYRSV